MTHIYCTEDTVGFDYRESPGVSEELGLSPVFKYEIVPVKKTFVREQSYGGGWALNVKCVYFAYRESKWEKHPMSWGEDFSFEEVRKEALQFLIEQTRRINPACR